MEYCSATLKRIHHMYHLNTRSFSIITMSFPHSLSDILGTPCTFFLALISLFSSSIVHVKRPLRDNKPIVLCVMPLGLRSPEYHMKRIHELFALSNKALI